MEWNSIIGMLSLTLYKLSSLAVGIALCYMGYKLFLSGIWGPKQGESVSAGEVQAQFGDNRILIKRAAPGTFFVAFGTAVLIFTIYRGLDLQYAANASYRTSDQRSADTQRQQKEAPHVEIMPASPPIK